MTRIKSIIENPHQLNLNYIRPHNNLADMKKEEQIALTEEIILTAFRLLTNKLGQGGLVASNEAAFQLEFGHILKTLGQLYEFKITDKFYLEFENSLFKL